ncbi:Protein CBG05951 [Caenorhabditis briggsae]|uniref:Uncharacterized protein n=2 Tax=Caenorhabditis briggsae TaxID=6238 RepID=A0AAE9AB92_CAEBR|nr:Protein CBG05951 [Caenorhabditis briggsae]ULT95224.1 hypothetical protein L3Y34_004152 [Caenorhabditis briggsae]UMM28425.1 hypothetical protein L5515_011274 [Caenorhabditis briggsae]CAP26402.1 Protein CBG05951 [Caenorhabditis briggsae]
MRFFTIALFFCILSNVFAWYHGDRVALADDEYDPEAIENRQQIAKEYMAREKFRRRIREEIAKEEIEHKYRREKIRRAMEAFNE